MPPSYAAGGVALAGTRSSAGNGATIVAAKYIGYLVISSACSLHVLLLTVRQYTVNCVSPSSHACLL